MSENVSIKRNVSFPSEDTQLITATYGPEDPWHKDEEITAKFLVGKYRESCLKHGVEPLPKLIQQLQELDYESEDQVLPSLDLSGCVLDFLVCETLEEILKRLRFDTINLEDTHISEEGAVALFEMVEYYEACQTLNISKNESIQARGWQACSRMIKKTQCLRALIAKEICLKEEYIPFLTRTLKIGTHLSVLNLERCHLNGRPITMLANALRMNRSLQEVYLGENGLESMDAYNLANLLTHNSNMQLLDLSNNIIGDKGAQHLCLCLAEKLQTQQRSPQSPTEGHAGLAVLNLWNNCLSLHSGQHFAKLLKISSKLEENSQKTPPKVKPSRVAENLKLSSRKISLTCEIKIPQSAPKKSLTSGRLRSPAPSPTPSPILSPIPSPGKSRFSVSKVPDARSPLPPPIAPIAEVKSRFSITPVRDIPKIVLPEENKITVGFQINDNSPDVFKFDQDSVKKEIIIKNDENFNFEADNNECDSEVEGLMKDGKKESPNEECIVEIAPKEKLETITEMNPAFIDSNNGSPTKPLHGILLKRSKFATFEAGD
ncbi:hypothetical protein B566_EDAN005979 [Ephemera danica]|nr:hypothetical protein B566_EDAN005979 [Ephemera danica]